MKETPNEIYMGNIEDLINEIEYWRDYRNYHLSSESECKKLLTKD